MVSLDEKIEKFISLNEINEGQIEQIVKDMRERSAYDQDKLTGYVMRRKAVLRLFDKMLNALENGKFELESVIHNIIFPMGLTNREVSYQYHNLWLLDERFATYRFIASDKSITSITENTSRLEPDIILFNDEHDWADSRMSFGLNDAGEIESMVIFEFKRPGETAHQKAGTDYRWNFGELVNKYFEDFLYGSTKKNYRGNPVNIDLNTPKFGYIIVDVIDSKLADYNLQHGWKKTPFGSFYSINPDLNLHLETITYQGLLLNAKKRMNPFFDHLFTSK